MSPYADPEREYQDTYQRAYRAAHREDRLAASRAYYSAHREQERERRRAYRVSDRPLLIDLYCSAGGAGEGYHRAGFDVIGVDIDPQPHYPHHFVRSDAITFLENVAAAGWTIAGRPIAAIHGSPPCQAFSTITKMHGAEQVATHPDLVDPTRALMIASGLPYVIENVVGAPLLDPLMLCGSMFGLGLPARRMHLRRHRLFESNVDLWPPASCAHLGTAIQVNGHAGGSSTRDKGAGFGSTADWREAMGIDWMTGAELAEAIPPAYAEWIGRALLERVTMDGGPADPAGKTTSARVDVSSRQGGLALGAPDR